MKRLLSLDLPLGSEIMTTVRLATGGICSLAGLDLDRSEDCKVCVTESLLLLMHAGFREARISFFGEDALFVRVEGLERGESAPSDADEISEALLGALAGSVVFDRADGAIVRVSFQF